MKFGQETPHVSKGEGMMSRQQTIPLVDLKPLHAEIRSEIDDAIGDVIDAGAFAGGPFVAAFEEAFAAAHDAKFCIAVNSGTSALHAAFWAMGIGLGDEVVVPTNTFIATAEAVSLTGATPVFADCQENGYGADPASVAASITSRTKAIVAVHLYGQPADLKELREIAATNGVALVEDCAQAHLAEYAGKKVGTYGTCGCFSFYPGKNLGALGEGGAVVTNDETLRPKIQALRNHGSGKQYVHAMVGHNYRMDGIQGAVLKVKLKHLPSWNKARRDIAMDYHRALYGIEELVLPEEKPDRTHVWHIYAIQCQQRDALMEHLKANGVMAGIHYPVPCHWQEAYNGPEGKRGALPNAEAIAGKLLSLPIYPGLPKDAVVRIAGLIQEFYRH
jgi:dTDP-4-amino-4,6-dideoxygalactose transaminase